MSKMGHERRRLPLIFFKTGTSSLSLKGEQPKDIAKPNYFDYNEGCHI